MKKLKFILVLAVLLTCAVAAVVMAEEKSDPKVTFKVELSTPIELPEDINRPIGLLRFPNGINSMSVDRMEYTKFASSMYFSSPSFEGELNLPLPVCYGDGITFEGWDVDPSTVDFKNLKEPMTFTARFNNDDSIPVFLYTSHMDGIPFDAVAHEDYPMRAPSSTAIIFVKKGHVLSESDKPPFMTSWLTGGYLAEYKWSDTFVGTEVNEPLSFTVFYNALYEVTFRYLNEAGEWDCAPKQYVFHGHDATPPENIPEIKGKVFSGWDIPYTNIRNNGEPNGMVQIFAVYYDNGDCNKDGVINTGDAVTVLKHCANIEMLTEQNLVIADMTDDKKINTGDAVAILKKCAE